VLLVLKQLPLVVLVLGLLLDSRLLKRLLLL
jgi:hypothetical protein